MKDPNNRAPWFGLALVLAALGGCSQVSGDAHEIGVTGDSSPPVSFAQFEQNATHTATGGYVVDGDIAIPNKSALRDYYESWHDDSSSLTVNQVFATDDLWPFPARYSLTYCVSNSFGTDKPALLTALAAATSSWQGTVGVHFTYVPAQDATCSSSNANVTFDVSPAPAGAMYYGVSFFPSYARADRSLLLTPSSFTTTSGGRDLQGIVRHELGHTIGFRHEHIWLSPTCTGESTSDARQVTMYDVNSVMHYPQCRPSGTGGYRQSPLDYTGAVSLYGLSPQLIMTL